MGNLSCVSCKIKDKSIQRSIGELSLGDYKGASFNQDLVRAADSKTSDLDAQDANSRLYNENYRNLSNEDGVRFVDSVELSVRQRRTTAGELYEILRSQRLKDDESVDDDNNLDDIEKAAKAIVDMTVFLTTQVIYPAYLRYLEEDHPEVYTQYFDRPTTPLPLPLALDNAITVGGPPPDNLDLRGTQPCPSCTERANQCYTEYYEEGGTVEPKKVKKTQSVRFSTINETITVAEYDILETLRYMQHHPELYDTEDEAEVLFQQLEQEKEGALDEDADESLISEQNSELALETKDSKDLSFVQSLAHPELSIGDVTSLLKELLQELSTGNLPTREVQDVAYLAKDLIMNIRGDVGCVELLKKTSSNASMVSITSVAQGIVQETINNVRKLLLKEEASTNKGDVEKLTSVTELSAFIVNKAVNLAIKQMIQIGDLTETARPGSAPPASPSADPGRHKSNTLEQSTSSTSEFINNILEKVVSEINAEVKKQTKEPSETSLLVRNILMEAENDLQENWFPCNEPVDWDNAPLCKSSSESVTGQLVRNTLYKVVRDIEEDGTFQLRSMPDSKSSSSMFAESLVADAIHQCLTQLRNGALPEHDVLQIASAILKQRPSVSDCTPADISESISLDGGLNTRLPTGGTSSVMIESLIRETLARVKCDMDQGILSTTNLFHLAKDADIRVALPPSTQQDTSKSNISFDAEEMVSNALNIALCQTSPNVATNDAVRSSTSLLAESYVEKALKGMTSFSKYNPTSDTSLIAERAVHMALEDALESAVTTQTPPSSAISSLAENVVKKAIDDILENNMSVGTMLQGNRSEPFEIRNILSGLLSSLKHPGSSGSNTVPEVVPDVHESQLEPHIIIDTSDYDDHSSEEDISICPVIGHEPVHIDHHVVENALSVFSVKKDRDLLEHNEDLAARNSFADLMHPDISSIKRFQNGSESEICQKIMSLSKHCISLPAHMAESKESPELTSYSAGGRLEIPENGLLKVEIEQDAISDDGQEEVVDVVTIHKVASLEELTKINADQGSSTKTSSTTKVQKKPSKPISPKKKANDVGKNVSSSISSSACKAKNSRHVALKNAPKTMEDKKHSHVELKKKNSTESTGKSSVTATAKRSLQSSSTRGKSPSRETVKLASKNSKERIIEIQRSSSKTIGPNMAGGKLSKSRKSSTTEIDTAVKLARKPSKDTPQPDECAPDPISIQDPEKTIVSMSKRDPSVTSICSTPMTKLIEPDEAASSRQTVSDDPIGRESPAAEIVEEEDLPVRRRNNKTGSNSSFAKSRMQTMAKSSTATVSTTVLSQQAINQSKARLLQNSKTAVSREDVQALDSKFSKVLTKTSSSKRSTKQSSHQMVNLTPRPSSGYRKSLTKQSISRDYIKRDSSNNEVYSSSESIDRKSNSSIESIPVQTASGSVENISAIPKRVNLTPKQSMTVVGNLTKRSDTGEAVAQVLSDTSCTHSEDGVEMPRKHSHTRQLDAQWKSSTGSLGRNTNSQHVLNKPYQSGNK